MSTPSYLPGDPFIIKYMRGRNDRGFSNIVLVEGPTRWGKSMACVEIGAVLDPQFDARKNIFHRTEQLLYAFKQPFHDYITFVLEEGGKAASVERWYDIITQILGWFAQSSAFKKFNFMINLTTEGSYAKKPREEVTLILEGHESLRRGEFFIKLPTRKHTAKFGTNIIYKQFPRIDMDGYTVPFRSYKFPTEEAMPGSIRKIWNDYLGLKSEDFDVSLDSWIDLIEQQKQEKRVKQKQLTIKELELQKKENKLLYGSKRNQSPTQLANLKHSGKKYKEALDSR